MNKAIEEITDARILEAIKNRGNETITDPIILGYLRDRTYRISKVLKKWAIDNYSNGADAIVECWSYYDYEAAISVHNYDYEEVLEYCKELSDYRIDRAEF